MSHHHRKSHYHYNAAHHDRTRENSHHFDVIDDRPMLESAEADSLEADAALEADSFDIEPATIDDLEDESKKYNDDFDKFLDEASEVLLKESSELTLKKDESHEDVHDVRPNLWYQNMYKKKIKEAKNRLEDLSKLACYTCDAIVAHIKRIEQDHGTTFCKMDFSPRYLPQNRPWTNSWKFNCTIKCRKADEPYHTHNSHCEGVVLEHIDPNMPTNKYPQYVEEAVKLFEDFACETNKDVPFSDSKESSDTAYQKTMWTGIKVYLRSNCRNELMMIVRGKKISPLVSKLRRYFKRGPETDSNVMSVFCLDQTWFPRMNRVEPENVIGLYRLVDKVGPISIEYKPKTNVDFNAMEATRLGKIIRELAGLTKETTLLDIGCNFGVLSLMMSLDCESVFGINTMHSVNNEIPQAEELKKFNKIHNVSFIACNPDDLLTKCSSYIKQCITVAVLNLSSPFGKNKHVVQALRNLPSIWRVIVYGSFTKEFHRNINTLITEDHTMGECYLPMQGCILDKSPASETAFDIVILFERKSLITPKIELFESGPTVNVKHDSDMYEYGSDVIIDMKPKYEESKDIKEKLEEKYPSRRSDHSRHREKDRSTYSSSSREFRSSRYSPAPKEERPHSSSRHRSSILSDRSTRRSEQFDSPPRKNHEKHAHQSRSQQTRIPDTPSSPDPKYRGPSSETRRGQQSPPRYSGKLTHQSRDERSRIPDTPSSPDPKNKGPSQTKRNGSAARSVRDELFDSPPRESKDTQASVSRPLLSVRKEFQFKRPSSPGERTSDLFRPVPRASDETDSLEKGRTRHSTLTTVKAEPIQENSETFKVPESTNPSYFVGFSDAYVANSEKSSAPPTNLKNEPEDMEISPTPPDIASMETPIHIPRALCDYTDSSSISSNPTLEDFEFPLQANLSYLPRDQESVDASRVKKEKDAGNSPSTTVGTEDDGVPRVIVKSEPVDTSYSVDEVNAESIPLPVIVKSEPVESHETPPVSVKNESVDMEISPNPHQDIESMETPMHNPRSLSDSTPASPLESTLSDFEFPVQPNLSYLPVKREPEPPVDTEPNDEIAVIGEKKSDKPKDSQPKIRVRSVDEVIKVKTELKEQDDLRTLYEQRQAILRKLGQEGDDSPRSYKRELSRSPDGRKHKRSPSASRKRSKRFKWSPSPYESRGRSSQDRIKREPRSPSSDRRKERSRRSPLSSTFKREVYGRIKSEESRWDRRSKRSRSRSPKPW